MTQDVAALSVAFRHPLDDFLLDVAFSAPATGITALFGRSGCGKTTLLRCLAGLTRPQMGRLTLGGVVWHSPTVFVPPHQRRIGYVFQEASLFPHLSVYDNLLFGRRHRQQQFDIAEQEVIELLGLEPLLHRWPQQLSGGQRQRVAIGRALLCDPQLLLMDEPLAALDSASKDEILAYLEQLHRRLAIPVVYVSHDLREVERLADYLLLIERGQIVSAGPLRDVLVDLKSPLTHQEEAGVVWSMGMLDYDAEYALSVLSSEAVALRMPGKVAKVGESLRVHIAARDVSLALNKAEDNSIINVFAARIVDVAAIDDARMNVVLAIADSQQRLMARVTRWSWSQLKLAPGQPVYAQVKAVSIQR